MSDSDTSIRLDKLIEILDDLGTHDILAIPGITERLLAHYKDDIEALMEEDFDRYEGRLWADHNGEFADNY